MKRLFLVESPTKIKTLKKILEKQVDQFTFLATLGHIKDLPTNNLGIDLDSFEPKLIFLPSNQNGSDTSARHILDAGHIAKEINEKLRDVGFEAKAVNVSTADRYTGIANVQDTADLTFYVGDKRFTISGVETNISLDRLVEKINRAAGTAGADLNASISDGRLVLTSSKGHTIAVDVQLNDSNQGDINLNQLIQGAQQITNTTNGSAIKVGTLHVSKDSNFTITALRSNASNIINNLGPKTVGTVSGNNKINSQFKNLYSLDVTTNENSRVTVYKNS